MIDQNLSHITDEDLAKAGLTRRIETREFIDCHLTEATHYFNPATETYHRRKCTSIHVGHGRNISTELAREIGWKPVMIVQPKEQMPKHREMILLASGNGSSVVVRRFNEFEKYDVQQFQIGNIFPDTPEGMKAARKKAGLDQ
jgi:hypothetical protein